MTIEQRNIERANRIVAAMAAYTKLTGCDDESHSDNICDLLTDIRHYCDMHDVCFDGRNDMARQHYHAETAGGE